MSDTFQIEVAAAFSKALETLTDIHEKYADTVFGGKNHLARVLAQRDGIAQLWERHGARLSSAATLEDALMVIGAIVFEDEPDAHVQFSAMVTPAISHSEMTPQQEGKRDASQFAVAEIRRLAAQHLRRQ